MPPKKLQYRVINVLLVILLIVLFGMGVVAMNAQYTMVGFFLWGALTLTSRKYKNRMPVSYAAWWWAMYVSKPQGELNDLVFGIFLCGVSSVFFFLLPSSESARPGAQEVLNHFGWPTILFSSVLVLLVCVLIGIFTERSSKNK